MEAMTHLRPTSARPVAQHHTSAMPSLGRQLIEHEKCRLSFAYFVDTYCHLKNERTKRWERFRLWPAQRWLCEQFVSRRFIVAIKARQIGFTWLALAYVLWLMLFHGAGTYLLFSVGLRESKKSLKRLRGMYERLVPWLKARDAEWTATEGRLSTGAEVISLPAGSGDSYTASGAILDEADLVQDQEALEEAVGPTIKDGGWCFSLSKVDKDRPDSLHKKRFVEAKKLEAEGQLGDDDWFPVFLPWNARPDRTPEWYEQEKAKTLRETGALDRLHANYPETIAEALSQRSLSKRLPPAWLASCYQERRPIDHDDLHFLLLAACLPGNLRVYERPVEGAEYVAGGDPAHGLPDGDDSALVVKRRDNGHTVCVVSGKYEPKVHFPSLTSFVLRWYNNAPILPERNDQGGAYIAGLQARGVTILAGPDGKAGYLQTSRAKHEMYDDYAADLRVRHLGGADPFIFDLGLYRQLGSINAATLSAPGKKKGRKAIDDEATAEVISHQALTAKPVQDGFAVWFVAPGEGGGA